MSTRGTNTDLAREVAALIRTLEDLQAELEPGDRRRLLPPTPGELLRFTSEVTIPAAIVVLETNVRVLRLLQRTIRMRTGDEDRTGTPSAVEDRARALGRETLQGLDATLADLQAAIEGRPASDEAATLLAEARRLREEVDASLAGGGETSDIDVDPGATDREPVNVDVESELQSIKDEMDDVDEDGTDDGAS